MRRRKSKFPDNQGKCCDAVLRALEGREGHIRTALTFPEQEGHSAPVELICTIGQSRYALEHTKLQTYPNQIQDGVQFSGALELLEQELVGKLPNHSAWFMLIVPSKAFDGLSTDKAIRIRENIAGWIMRVAPTLKLPVRGIAHLTENVDSVPFAVTLQAIPGTQDFWGKLRIARLAPPDLDTLRLNEVGNTLTRKLPKLKAWSEEGVKTVLVLETEDIALADHHEVLEGLKHHLPLHGYFPDYVFFVYAIGSPWLMQTLVAGRSFPTDIFEWPVYLEFNPEELNDICANP
jgi:hypothetical protein